MENEWDIIVIGSGMGGMVTAAALSRVGHKVLMLEQYDKLGGQTHSFSREGFSWDAGMNWISLPLAICMPGFSVLDFVVDCENDIPVESCFTASWICAFGLEL